MRELEKVLSTTRKAVQHYNMIEDGDRIAVGLSGGKDSSALLYALCFMRRFYPAKYDVVGITVDPGFPEAENLYSPVTKMCDELGVEHRIVKTEIYNIVFEERKEKSPCSLCAMMRRGALNSECSAAGANKLALGHHMDDAVETFMMSLMYEGQASCFSPVTVYENVGVTMIRPFIYTPESAVKALVKAAEIPIVESPCPENGNTERAAMKEYLRSFDREHRGLYRRILGALERGNLSDWRE